MPDFATESFEGREIKFLEGVAKLLVSIVTEIDLHLELEGLDCIPFG